MNRICQAGKRCGRGRLQPRPISSRRAEQNHRQRRDALGEQVNPPKCMAGMPKFHRKVGCSFSQVVICSACFVLEASRASLLTPSPPPKRLARPIPRHWFFHAESLRTRRRAPSPLPTQTIARRSRRIPHCINFIKSATGEPVVKEICLTMWRFCLTFAGSQRKERKSRRDELVPTGLTAPMSALPKTIAQSASRSFRPELVPMPRKTSGRFNQARPIEPVKLPQKDTLYAAG
jgi:hypothetical protein